jgi:predicted unusual protein kinase regulating ubiquinone biosynthesis (AarF/ABC1/UbiB family)
VSRRTLVLTGSGAALAGAAVGATVTVRRALADPRRRARVQRSIRVWRLTARRGAHFAVVKVRGARADDEARARLEEQFLIRSAEDVATELGHMKGVVMKLGQLASVVAEGLPPEAHAAIEALQADTPPMAPSLAEQVVREELGASPEHLFLDWDPVPVAAASIGQVHRAVVRDGREVAVKVQYPGVSDAIGADLDNAEMLYGLVSSFALKGLDTKALVEELRARMGEELDYRREAANQQEFARRFRGHPFIHVPEVVPERSSTRVLTTEWVGGRSWQQFDEAATEAERQHAGEVLFRFVQSSVNLYRSFNGDPHPGNYRFHADGRVSFLDFGLVKHWEASEWDRLSPCMDAIIIDRDPDALVVAMEDSGFLQPGHGLDPVAVYGYVSAPYVPYLTGTFTFTRSFVGEALAAIADIRGPYAEVIPKLNLPASFVILDRVVWAISALLGKLGAHGPWREILLEYRRDAPPATPLGELEHAWRATHRAG